MQLSRTTDFPWPTRAHARPLVVVAMLLALLLGSMPATTAQESTPDTENLDNLGTPPAVASPAASPAATPQAPADVFGTILMSYDFEELPPAPLTVRLLRITLEPGASSQLHFHPGPEFNLVESGTLTANIDGPAVLGTGSESSEITETQTVTAGEWVMYPAGTNHNPTNDGDEPLVILAAVVLPVGADIDSTITYVNDEPAAEDLAGVSFVVLGDGLIQQLPAGPGTVTVDQLTVAAGEPIPGFSGPALLSKTSGDFAISAGEGVVQVTRTATPQLQPNAIPGQEFVLEDNDAAFFPSGYTAIPRPDSTGDVTFTRLLIQPEGDLANGLATVTAIPVDTAVEEPAEPVVGDGLGVGAIVAMNEDAVRVRAEPTTESAIVDSFPVGTQFQIVSGPTEAEGFAWYQVVGTGDLSGVEGWFPSQFMDVIEPATGQVQVETEDGSAGSDPAGEQTTEELPIAEDLLGNLQDVIAEEPVEDAVTVAEIAVGSIVATNDTNVRIRTEPNTGGDIVQAVATGTQFEVIGGPEAADDFTWVEVQAVDDPALTGWTAIDFLDIVEPAP